MRVLLRKSYQVILSQEMRQCKRLQKPLYTFPFVTTYLFYLILFGNYKYYLPASPPIGGCMNRSSKLEVFFELFYFLIFHYHCLWFLDHPEVYHPFRVHFHLLLTHIQCELLKVSLLNFVKMKLVSIIIILSFQEPIYSRKVCSGV